MKHAVLVLSALSTLALSACSGKGTYQVDTAFGAYRAGYARATVDHAKDDCKDAKDAALKRVCHSVDILAKINEEMIAQALTFDQASEALKGKLMQLGLKAATGL